MSKRGEKAATEALFEDLPHEIIEISDDGFDIQAYLKVAKVLPHDYIFFCNTYTEFATENWLAKIMNFAEVPDVGIVATSASFESLHDSHKLYSKLLWLTTTKLIAYNKGIAEQYRAALDLHDRGYMAAFHSVKGRLRRFIGDITKGRVKYTSELDREFDQIWDARTAKGTAGEVFRKFAHFPNPHVRSTAFLMSRRLLLSYRFDVPNTKMDCALFESGNSGLSVTVRNSGKRLLLVGADGKGFDVDQWPQSGTFRQGRQENCITRDNHISAYNNFEKRERELLHKMTWGEYSKEEMSDFVSLGSTFPMADSLDIPVKQINQPHRLKYSIVIPTHNRLELTKDAIETVRRQTFSNWEVIVFDNSSTEPLESYVNSLADPRIKFKRSDDFLPVTESWNCAINEATGDYVMLIGDDDGLKPNFFERLDAIVQKYSPDMIYSSILQFFHPGVAPWRREGYVTEVRSGSFFVGRGEAFLLDHAIRRAAVEGSLQIRRSFSFNMQAQIYKRQFIERLKIDGKFFHSPFPDYYIANVAFALADTIVVEPEAMAIAGVSRASFGFTLFNNLEAKGAALLNSDYDKDPGFKYLESQLLPGPGYTTSYLVTMQHVADRLKNWTQVRPDIKRYRRMQIFATISNSDRGMGWVKSVVGKLLWSRLSILEKAWAFAVSWSKRSGRRKESLYEREKKRLDPMATAPLSYEKNVGDFVTTNQLFTALENGQLSDRDSSQETSSSKRKMESVRERRQRMVDSPSKLRRRLGKI